MSYRWLNGPAFIATALAEWARDHRIDLDFIQPGKPAQNSYVKRFNRTCRDEVLNLHVFRTLTGFCSVSEAADERSAGDPGHFSNSLDDRLPFVPGLDCHTTDCM